MSYRLQVAAVLLMTAVIGPLASQQQPVTYGVAYVIAEGTGSDAALKQIVSQTIAVQLARRQTAVQNLGAASSSTLSRMLSAASAGNTQYLLLASYTTTDLEMSLALHLYDVATSQEVGGATASGRIDLSLDALVAKAIDRAVRGVVFRQPPPKPAAQAPQVPTAQTSAQAAQVPTAQPSAQAAAAPSTQAPQVPAAQPAAEPSTHPAGIPAAEPSAQPADVPAAQPSTPAPRRRVTFGVSSGAAPLLLTGVAGSYATIGGLATFSADFRIPVGAGTFSAGILSGAAAMQAAGAVTEADVLLVPIGLDALYTLNEGGFPGITLRVSGGPAIMNVSAPYSGSLTKVIPYALAGMLLELPFAPWIGLSVDAQWAMFFESLDFLIMGFAPEVSLYVRF